jgi:hypothetical protein
MKLGTQEIRKAAMDGSIPEFLSSRLSKVHSGVEDEIRDSGNQEISKGPFYS